jgi:RNA polymerase sigma-32 factor
MLPPEVGLMYYLTEIRKFPMLRPDEESAYAKRWREQGDSEAAYAHRPVDKVHQIEARAA